jgi:hypothetical protein
MRLCLIFLAQRLVSWAKRRKSGYGFAGRSMLLDSYRSRNGLVGSEPGVAASDVRHFGIVVVSRVSGRMVGIVGLPQVSEEVSRRAFFPRNTHERP